MDDDRHYVPPQHSDSFARTMEDESTISHPKQKSTTPTPVPSRAAVSTSTPKYSFEHLSEMHDSRELVDQLQFSIGVLETHMNVLQDHAKEQVRRLHDKFNDKKEELNIAIDLLSNERAIINQEKADLSKQLANTRVELKNVKDQLKASQNQAFTDTKDLAKKLKTVNDDRIRDKSELSSMRVQFNDQKRLISEQKQKSEDLEAQNKKLKETNIKIMSTLTQLRLQNQGLQQSLTARLSDDVTTAPTTARTTSRFQLGRSSENLSNALPTARRQSRPNTSLRFSNRTQVRDITPPKFSSMTEQERPDSPQGIESEIHTASCRHNCHLFEHEGDEGRFRWVCGINDRVVVVYREQRYVIFIPDVAEIQFFGDGTTRGQIIIFWTSDESTREISVCRTNGSREEYRVDDEGNVISREIFNFDGSVYRINGEETVQIEPNEATPLSSGAQTIQHGPNDVQIHHLAFGLRVVNYEFLRVQIIKERLQITACLCDDRRVFNVKHCTEGFQQKTLCTFIGQCPNMQIR